MNEESSASRIAVPGIMAVPNSHARQFAPVATSKHPFPHLTIVVSPILDPDFASRPHQIVQPMQQFQQAQGNGGYYALRQALRVIQS
ncbi:hypothetical protein Scep_014674 [Stephania cephalantha]|uniref:Uncharacterized protein n=1 Tax=Stephania cephalantha TaxID=152367 RepID=A0AAP0P0L9_9MAGN